MGCFPCWERDMTRYDAILGGCVLAFERGRDNGRAGVLLMNARPNRVLTRVLLLRRNNSEIRPKPDPRITIPV